MGSNGLTNQQKKISYLMLSFEDISEYEIADVIIAFGNLLKKEDIVIIKELIERYSDEIHSELKDYLYDNDDIIEELYYLVDSVKNIKNKSEKHSEERKIIREELNRLKELCAIYSSSYEKENAEDEAYYKIIDKLLSDEANYDKIEELLKRKNKICNIKHDNRHIVLHILDSYIFNLKQMIKDKNSKYIDPAYLKRVYYLFTKNPYCHLSRDERFEANVLLKEMDRYVKESLKTKKRRKKARKELDSLKPSRYYRSNITPEDREYTDDFLLHFSMDIKNNMQYIMKDEDYEEVFLCHNRPYKMEIRDDKSIKITVFAINYEPVISEKSLIQEYFEYCEYKKIKIDSFFHGTLNPKMDKMYPAIGYELTFYPSGKFKSLSVRQTNIKVVEENKVFKENENMSSLHDLYKKSVIKNGGIYSHYDLGNWNKHFENILENEYVVFLHDNKLPFIYYGYSNLDKELVERNMNELNSYFSSLTKADTYEITDILTSNTDRFHYSVLPIDDAVYEMHLLDPISYLGIENQRMLNHLYFNCRKYEDMERLHRLKLSTLYKYIENVDELNDSINYVGITKKYSRGKIKNLSRL